MKATTLQSYIHAWKYVGDFIQRLIEIALVRVLGVEGEWGNPCLLKGFFTTWG